MMTADSVRYPGSRNRRCAIGVVAVTVLFDLFLVTDGTFNLFNPFGPYFVYNSMALHMLAVRFDVDPASIGPQAYIHGGRPYAYFGIFPALLRLPLVPFLDLTTFRLEGLSF